MGGSNLANQTGTYGTRGNGCPGQRSWGTNSAVIGPMRPGISGSSVGMVTTQRGQSDTQRPVEVQLQGQWTWMGGSNLVNQRGRTGLKGRRRRQRSWGAWLVLSLDRCGRKFLALRWAWLRLSGGTWTPQRPVEVQRGPMDVDERVEPGQPAGNVRHSGDGCPQATFLGRVYPTSWTDEAGNFWLFGGQGYDSKGTGAFLNDLWKYEP